MGDMKVQFGDLESLADDIKTRVDGIEGKLGELDGQIKQIEGIWVGAANEGFIAKKQEWYTAAEHLKAVLGKIETAVRVSTDGYRDAEDRNTKRWD
jgi:6 kDa early secretory antigenic target